MLRCKFAQEVACVIKGTEQGGWLQKGGVRYAGGINVNNKK